MSIIKKVFIAFLFLVTPYVSSASVVALQGDYSTVHTFSGTSYHEILQPIGTGYSFTMHSYSIYVSNPANNFLTTVLGFYECPSAPVVSGNFGTAVSGCNLIDSTLSLATSTDAKIATRSFTYTLNPAKFYMFWYEGNSYWGTVSLYGSAALGFYPAAGCMGNSGANNESCNFVSAFFQINDAPIIPVGVTITHPLNASVVAPTDAIAFTSTQGDLSGSFSYVLNVGSTTGNYTESYTATHGLFADVSSFGGFFQPLQDGFVNWIGTKHVRLDMYLLDGTSLQLIATSSDVGFLVENIASSTSSRGGTVFNGADFSGVNSMTREGFASSSGCSSASSTYFDIFGSIWHGGVCALYDGAGLIFLPSQKNVNGFWSEFIGDLQGSFPFSIFYQLSNDLNAVADTATSTHPADSVFILTALVPDSLPTSSPAYALESLNASSSGFISGFHTQDDWFATNKFWNGPVKYFFALACGFGFGLYVITRTFGIIGFKFGAGYWEVTDVIESQKSVEMNGRMYKGPKTRVMRTSRKKPW